MAALITCWAVRCVRSNSRMDCCAKIGAKSNFCAAARCPGVANPKRSPNPKDFTRPSVVGDATGLARNGTAGVVFLVAGPAGDVVFIRCHNKLSGHMSVQLHLTTEW